MNAPAIASVLSHPAGLVLAKVTVVLTLTCIAVGVATELSAARRHLLFVVALSSCAVLLLASPVVPSIVIHAPILSSSVASAAAHDTPMPQRSSSGAMLALTPEARAQSTSDRHGRDVRRRSLPRPSDLLVVLWVVGFAVMVCRHAAAIGGAVRLAHRASIATDDESIRQLASAAAMVGVRDAIRLCYSSEVSSPVTFGLATPVVLVPNEARCWSSETRRAVLLHEAAHIARGDWLAQTLARFARDLFWLHPLAWYVFARLRDDAERAADDCVLRAGMPAVEYAAHVLDVVGRTSDARPSVAAVGIVSRSDLERRFVAMFDARQSRTTVTSRMRAIAASAALAVVSPLASLHVEAHAPARTMQRLSLTDPVVATNTASLEQTSHGLRADRPHVSSVRAGGAMSVAVERAQPSVVGGEALERGPTGARPDFSGTWRQDTVAGPVVGSYVTDSTVIRQSESAISIESRGHFLFEPTHNRFLTIPFDGAGIQGHAVTGSDTASFIASALWYGDTLVVDTHANGANTGGTYVHTIERMTLGPDGNTLYVDNLSYVGGRYRWGGPHTFVLRRVAP